MASEEGACPPNPHPRAFRQMTRIKIFAKQRRGTGACFNKRDRRCASTQRFNPDRSGTCIEVQEASARHTRPEYRKERLSDLI
jgi:hypothetical protein